MQGYMVLLLVSALVLLFHDAAFTWNQADRGKFLKIHLEIPLHCCSRSCTLLSCSFCCCVSRRSVSSCVRSRAFSNHCTSLCWSSSCISSSAKASCSFRSSSRKDTTCSDHPHQHSSLHPRSSYTAVLTQLMQVRIEGALYRPYQSTCTAEPWSQRQRGNWVWP